MLGWVSERGFVLLVLAELLARQQGQWAREALEKRLILAPVRMLTGVDWPWVLGRRLGPEHILFSRAAMEALLLDH